MFELNRIAVALDVGGLSAEGKPFFTLITADTSGDKPETYNETYECSRTLNDRWMVCSTPTKLSWLDAEGLEVYDPLGLVRVVRESAVTWHEDHQCGFVNTITTSLTEVAAFVEIRVNGENCSLEVLSGSEAIEPQYRDYAKEACEELVALLQPFVLGATHLVGVLERSGTLRVVDIHGLNGVMLDQVSFSQRHQILLEVIYGASQVISAFEDRYTFSKASWDSLEMTSDENYFHQAAGQDATLLWLDFSSSRGAYDLKIAPTSMSLTFRVLSCQDLDDEKSSFQLGLEDKLGNEVSVGSISISASNVVARPLLELDSLVQANVIFELEEQVAAYKAAARNEPYSLTFNMMGARIERESLNESRYSCSTLPTFS